MKKVLFLIFGTMLFVACNNGTTKETNNLNDSTIVDSTLIDTINIEVD